MAFKLKTLFISMILLCITSITLYAQEGKSEYQKTIEMADSYFTKGDYINAKASYQIAVRLAPEEQYPKDRLQQSLDMIKVQMYQNSLYTQKIQVADDLYNKQQLDEALKYYQEALTILPGDVYASGKIQEINRTKVNSEELEANYQKNISSGDKYLKEGKLDQALAEYKSASALKPAEAYPREKVLQVENQIDEKKKITDEFQVSMRNAELAVSRNKYDTAIALLEKAINLVPTDPLPKQKLAEAQNLKAAWDSYNSIINAADEYYMNKDFQQAKDKYLQAQSIKPEDEYPKRMLEKIDIALMDVEQANRSSYEFAIEKADALYNQQDYEKAMVEYNNALRFKPDADYAKQRINDINNALNLRKSQDEAYKQSIARADLLFTNEKYEEARDEYNRAIGFKPLEQYPKVKVEEINTKLADLATKKGVYNNLIKGADKLFFSDAYEEAREQYREASYMFPQEKYPKDQITMINEILGVRDKYVKAVTKADQLLYEKDYEAALMEYRNAAGINPKETYPAEKIKEIEALQANLALQQKMLEEKNKAAAAAEEEKVTKEEYDASMEAYNKNQVFEVGIDSALLKEQQEQEDLYLRTIESADLALQDKDYQKALEDYQAARKLKPGEVYAEKKIAEVQAILSDLAAKQAALDKQYNETIGAADKDLAAKDYQKALTGYQAASVLKPGEIYPKGKIEEINNTLADIAAKKAAEEEAARIAAAEEAARIAAAEEAARKSAEEAARIAAEEEAAKIAAQAALDKQYADAISTADKALDAKDFNAALTGYNSASNLKPQENYPKAKIEEINKTLADIAAKKAAEEEAARIAAVEEAAKKAAAEEAARVAAAEEAARIAAAEEAARKSAEEAARIAAEEEAARKAAEEALNNQYADAISNADKALAASDYQVAKTAYQSASALKPQENYPKAKIEEIDKALADIAAKKAAEEEAARIAAAEEAAKKAAAEEAARIAAAEEAARIAAAEEAAKKAAEEAARVEAEKAAAKKAAEEALNKQYADAISAADKLLATKDYQNAIKGYQSASSLKPDETYPKDKISEIGNTLDEIARQEEINKQYNAALASANNLFQEKKYEEARTAYQEASAIKPSEDVPKKQILEIDRTLQAMEAERDQAYQVAVTKADGFAALKDYEMAKINYMRALELKPNDPYATQKLDEVNTEIIKKRQIAKMEYDKVIIEADKSFNSKTYDEALASYRAASVLLPDEEYPKEMAARIVKILSERSIVQINKDRLLIPNNTTHKFEFIPVPAKDRKSNYIYFKARNISKHDYKLIVSFGKDQTKNGGLVVKVPASEDLYDYIVRISAQYKWFSDDNNWISFYPEGGDIEVYLMQVSYSD